MKRARIIFGFTLGLPFFSIAHAQDAGTIADVRCLLVGSQMSRSLDTTQQSFGTIAIMYFLGRLDRILQTSDLEALIASEASAMSAAELRTEAIRCGKIIVEKGQLLQRIGNNLVFRDQRQSEKKSTPSP